ncbi:MAG: xanthine dehydrogenase family protein subunit M [Alphaproteobacteria bacterium]
MIPFDLQEPKTLRDAVALLDTDDPSIRPIAGGTALMLMMKAGLFQPRALVSLRAIEQRYSRVEGAADGAIHIGAMTPLSALERSSVVRQGVPVIAQTLRTLSNVRVRNVATVGGHLAHADPHMDLPPVLIALGAKLIVVGPKGERSLPVEDLHVGYLETSLQRGELIAELIVPSGSRRRAAYLKCTTRSADDWPALGVAAALEVDGDAIRAIDLVVGAVTDKPTRLRAAEKVLRGARADEKSLRAAGEAAAAEVDAIDDERGSAAYKKQLIRVYVARAVQRALAQAEVRP